MKKIIKWVALDDMGDYVSDEGFPTNHSDRALVCDTKEQMEKELVFVISEAMFGPLELSRCRIVQAEYNRKTGEWIEIEVETEAD